MKKDLNRKKKTKKGGRFVRRHSKPLFMTHRNRWLKFEKHEIALKEVIAFFHLTNIGHP